MEEKPGSAQVGGGPPRRHRQAAAAGLGLIVAVGAAVGVLIAVGGGTGPTSARTTPSTAATPPASPDVSAATAPPSTATASPAPPPVTLPPPPSSGAAPTPPISGAWAAAAAPSGPAALTSIACPGANECWAIGATSDPTASGDKAPVIDRFNGAAWSSVTAPQLSGGQLASIACPGPADCWAVGWGSGSTNLLIAHYDGGGWSVAAGPALPQGDVGGLDGVACTGAADCWAVGGVFTANAAEPLIAHYAGSGWSLVAGPAVASGGELHAVACVALGECWAVGETDGGNNGLIEHLSGGGWAVVPGPDLSDPGGYLDAITCPAAGECWAGGGGPEAEGPPVVEHLSGGAWSTESVAEQPSASAGSGTISGIACSSLSDCWAVGYEAMPAWDGSLVEHYDGTAWTAMSIPAPSGSAGMAFMEGITCAEPSPFMAVGYAIGGQHDDALIETATAAG